MSRNNERLKVGMKVRLRKDSEYWGQSGEINLGKVIEVGDYQDLPYEVKWERKSSNYYNERDLIITSVAFIEDHLKEKDVL